MERRTVVVGYARTPFGKLMGGLSTLAGTELGSIAIRGALERSGVAADQVEHVIMGQVLQAGAGQIPARQAAVGAGLPFTCTAETINKVCASGLRAVSIARTMINAGDHDVIVAGGMESMSRAPFLLPQMRGGQRMGNGTFVDAMINDGLWDPFLDVHMVVNGANVADEFGISRERQDEWACRSHLRAVAARDRFAEEIVPVTIKGRKGDTVVEVDEAPRPDTTLEGLAKLPPIMKKDGTATAGNAPGVNDGAAALVIASEEWANAHGTRALAYVRGHAYVAGDSPYLAVMPGLATQKLLEKEGLAVSDIDRFEFNEAFSSVALHSTDMLGADPERVNVNGGAVALGHPIGASGARIVGTLVTELVRIGGGLGIAGICSGGGQGDAILVEVPKA